MSINIKGVTSCVGYQQITSTSSAFNLTVPTQDKLGNKQQPTVAYIVCETQAIRWRDDGVDPTTTVGMPLAVNTAFPYDGDLSKIRMIASTAGAVVNVSYYA